MVDTVIKITTTIIPFYIGQNIDAMLSTKLNKSGKNGKSLPCMTGFLLLTEGKQSPRMTKPHLEIHMKGPKQSNATKITIMRSPIDVFYVIMFYHCHFTHQVIIL